MANTFRISVEVPAEVLLPNSPEKQTRESFFQWVWSEFGPHGLVGVHEGTLLCEEAAEQGFEVDSWTVDSAEAPKERDWVGQQSEIKAEFFFSDEASASHAKRRLEKIAGLKLEAIEEQVDQDWDAQWKASFLNAGSGVVISPFWRIVPPWVKPEDLDGLRPSDRLIRINPGAGFGTGTHETTQLCLEALGNLSASRSVAVHPGGPFENLSALDFGSGSGILSIGLAILGAKVDSVEIDTLALDNAADNIRLNAVESRIQSSQYLSAVSKEYDLVVANILRPVLLEFAEKLVNSLTHDGFLILSGLIQSDVDSIVSTYSRLIQSPPLHVYEKGEWRAIVFKKVFS